MTQRAKATKRSRCPPENPDLVSSRDKLGNTPLRVVSLHGQPAIAALLLANGADVNAQNDPDA
jgi:ankyrin repeat protein